MLFSFPKTSRIVRFSHLIAFVTVVKTATNNIKINIFWKMQNAMKNYFKKLKSKFKAFPKPFEFMDYWTNKMNSINICLVHDEGRTRVNDNNPQYIGQNMYLSQKNAEKTCLLPKFWLIARQHCSILSIFFVQNTKLENNEYTALSYCINILAQEPLLLLSLLLLYQYYGFRHLLLLLLLLSLLSLYQYYGFRHPILLLLLLLLLCQYYGFSHPILLLLLYQYYGFRHPFTNKSIPESAVCAIENPPRLLFEVSNFLLHNHLRCGLDSWSP